MTEPTKKLASEAEGWKITAAECLTEYNTKQLEQAASFLRSIKQMKAKINDFCAPNIKRLHDAHKAAIADRDGLLRPVEEAEAIINDKILKYRAWEREEARKAQEAAAKAQRAAEEAARKAEAESLREAGAEEAAKMVEEAPPAPVVAVAAAAPVKTEGVFTRTSWKAEVTSKMELIKFVAQNPAFLHLLDVSSKECNALARSQKAEMQIPGLKVVKSESIVAKV